MGSSPVRIRRILPEEGLLLRAVRVLAVTDAPEAFGQTREVLLARTDAEWRATAQASSEGPSRAWFLAETEGRVVGLVQGRRRPPDTLLIFSMWTAPEVRRMGIGRALIDVVETWAAGWGARSSVLWVVHSNEPARHFYQRLGFTPVSHGPDARSGAEHASTAMRRAIAPPSAALDA